MKEYADEITLKGKEVFLCATLIEQWLSGMIEHNFEGESINCAKSLLERMLKNNQSGGQP